MADIKIVASGICYKCNHPHATHLDNTGCVYPMGDEPCGCDSIGTY